ncbi:MAG: insulinase family protein, partial [Planctomycetota bacterium]
MFLDTPLDDEVIVWDPLLIGSRTSNGAMFGYRMHYNPDNISLVALHIRAGSMDELPGESGAAALVHRLALDHTVNLPDGSAVEFLTSRGWSEEDPGFVSPSETVYNFFLFEPTQEEIDRLYTLMGDIAGHLEFREADFLREREALARELDAREADGSLGRYDWIVAGAKGTELGEHPPMGLSPEAVRSLTLEDVQRFYERTYTPKRISTVGYGKGLPNRHLLKFDARVNVLGPVVDASRSDRGVLGDLPLRVTVLRDSAAERAQFNVVTFTEQHPVPAYFGEMIPYGEDRQVATTMTERMRRLIEAGELSAEIAAMRIEGLGTEVRTVRVVAEGEPAGWRDLVFDVASALGQAREGGFLTDEYGTALRVGTLDIGDAAAAHGKVHPRESIGWQIDRLDEGRVISALGQETIHMQGGAFETTIERVNERFNEVIDPEGSGLVLVLPAGAELPSETDVRDAFLAGLEDAERTGLRTEALLPNPPERGAVVEITEDAESGVWSAWLSNGVRVHYRYMPNSQDLVTTRIVLAGGQIEEDAGNRGITDGALSSWIQPETDELDNRQFLTLLSGHRVRFLPNRSVDALYLDMFSDDE